MNSPKDYRESINAVIQATVVHSTTTFSWFGQLSEGVNSRIKSRLSPSLARDYLHFNLKFRLYSNFYCRGLPTPIEPGVASFLASRTPFIKTLSTANSGQGYWKTVSNVRSIEGEEALVEIEGLRLRVPQGAILRGNGDTDDNPRVKLPKEFLGMSPGFYMALSDTALTPESMNTLVRVYWHLLPEGAGLLMERLTAALNAQHLPFNFKVLNDPSRYRRCDAAVLYFRKQDYGAISKVLEQIYPSVSPWLRSGTPAFTKPLAHGLGLAEDPGDGDSFGLHRCGILADGLIQAHEQGVQSTAQKLNIIEDCFAAQGISLEAPFLKPKSLDEYASLKVEAPQIVQPARASSVSQPTRADAYLETAHGIGQKICQSAIWHEERCNWIGAEPERLTLANPGIGSTWLNLGSDLYGGTSGIALFLGELYSVTQDSQIRRTALGAVRHALSQVETCPPPFRMGFYSGWIGIAFAAARVGQRLKDASVQEAAVALVNRTLKDIPIGPEFDLISGAAGGLSGLLALKTLLPEAFKVRDWLDFAHQLGKFLIQSAVPEAAGCSWQAKKTRSRNLVGFSHGTAGVAYALLELSHVTGEARYRQVAEKALDYERYWFSAEAGNWPDFRENSFKGWKKEQSYSYMTAWCHGASGIALSRLRAYCLGSDELAISSRDEQARYRTEAIAALETTYQVTESWLSSPTANYSLCHGLAGNAETLIYGTQTLGDVHNPYTELVHRIATQGIERYGANHQWPGGIREGESPGLMLGLSGIGYFYLRLYESSIPSILIIQPQAVEYNRPVAF